MWNLANSLSKLYPQNVNAAALAFLLLPTVVFWSSGLSKESLVMALLGFGLARVLPYFKDSSMFKNKWLLDIIIWTVCVIFLWLIKFYYLAALIPCLVAFLLSKFILTYSTKQKILQKFPYNLLLLVFVLVCIIGTGTMLAPGLDIKSVMMNIVSNHNVTYIFSQPQDLIHYTIVPPKGYITLSPYWSSFIYNSPQAFFSGLFRPFLWETGGNKLKILIALENFIILILSIYALINYLRQLIFQKNITGETHLLIWSTLLYISILVTLLAFASPNFGSLVRYKVALTPFLFYLISIDLIKNLEKKLFKTFPGIKKFFF